MRLILCILLLVGYLMGFMRPFLPYLDYQLRYTYYAEVLCKNKARPQLRCDGKCALAQKLKASTEQQAPQAPAGEAVKDFLSPHLEFRHAICLLHIQAAWLGDWQGIGYAMPARCVPVPPPRHTA